MSLGVARELITVELLMLRKKRSSIAVALVFALGPLAIFFVSKALQHAGNPLISRPAGGLEGFVGAVNVLGLILGPLAAVLIGVQAGVADIDAGVFRDLVATGRARRVLFAVRIPAAIAVLVPILAISFAVILLGTFTLADGVPTPGPGLILRSFGFVLLANVAVTVVADPATLDGGRPEVTMPISIAVAVLLTWALAFTAAGAWRTTTADV